MSENLPDLPEWLARGITDLFPLPSSTSDKDNNLGLRVSEALKNMRIELILPILFF